MNVDFKHLTPYTLGLDSADGPEDLLRLIWGEVLQKSVPEQRLMMLDIQAHPDALERYYEQLGVQLTSLRAYLILSNDDPIDVGEVVPHWVVELLSRMKPTVQPLIFLVVGRSLPAYMQQKLVNHGGEVALPSLDDSEASQLARMVIGAIDPMRFERWEPHITDIVAASGNNSKLLVDIIKTASRRANLDFLAHDARMHVERFDERLQRVLEWAWQEIEHDSGLVQLLDVLNLLGPIDILGLEAVFCNEKAWVGQWLYRLIQVGIVEALSESVYRVPRALARRINTFLTGAAWRNQSHKLIERLAHSIEIGSDEHGGVILTNRIQAQLATESVIDEADLVFVTTAMLFKSGWQRYRLGRYSAALKLLRRAFENIDRVRDDSTRLEICRYYGLCAGREHAEEDVSIVCSYLGKTYNFHHRFKDKVRAMALFIQAFALKSDSKFAEALPKYEGAISILPEGGAERQLSQMLNETIQCILRIEPVDYNRAIELGVRLCKMRETPNNIDVYLRALLGQTYYCPGVSRATVHSNLKEMKVWEERLRQKCESSNLSFFSRRILDRMEADALEAVLANGAAFPALDLSAAILVARDAYNQYQDESLVWRKWDLMLLTEVGRDWTRLHAEASHYLNARAPNRMARGNAARIRILTFDVSADDQRKEAYAELDKFRKDGTLPRFVATDIRRQLDLGDQRGARVLDKFVKRGLRSFDDK